MPTATAMRSVEHFKKLSPELQQIKDTEVENIFFAYPCSAASSTKMMSYSLTPADAKLTIIGMSFMG